MDLNKIFIKDACPTKIGGQAVLEGVMMRNQRQIAISVRKADGSIQTKKYVTKPKGAWAKWPFIRGVFAFVDSLIIGTGTLMYSAEVLEDDAGEVEEKGKLETWIENKFGGKAAYNFMIWTSVLISLVFTIGVFIILPTVAVNWTKKVTENAINFAKLRELVPLVKGHFELLVVLVQLRGVEVGKDTGGDVRGLFLALLGECSGGLEIVHVAQCLAVSLAPWCRTVSLFVVAVVLARTCAAVGRRNKKC